MPRKQTRKLSEARRFTSMAANPYSLAGVRKDLRPVTMPTLPLLSRGDELLERADARIDRLRSGRS